MEKCGSDKYGIIFYYRTGRTMKIEPLTTAGQLRNYILRMVARQWYDCSRESFNFVKQIVNAKKHGKDISFDYTSDFDERGISIFFLLEIRW